MKFAIYLLVTAGVTYLVRMVPMVALKKKIRNRFLLSFLHYVPYAVLSVMTVPAIFYATEEPLGAAAGFVVALILAWRGKSLLQVAAAACGAVLLVQLFL
jgi:branched-subunit amino acid transport protein